MARIVLVHGIGQQYSGEESVLAEWLPALRDGLKRAAAEAQADRGEVAAAFYGDLFRPPGRPLGAGDPLYTAADVAPGLEEDLLLAWWAEAAVTDPGVVAPDARTLARTPASVQAGLRALSGSRFFAGLAARVMIADLKQVARYFSEPGLRASARSRVSALIGPETAVVVGHSLGSVVAYEALCSLPRHGVRALVTVGSPLGIRALITDRLEPPPAAGGAGVWPGGPELTWTNVADEGDVVAVVKDLRAAFGPRVRGYVVHNGSHAHAVTGYLTARETGAAIAAGLGAQTGGG
jgi:hypothetical protein